MCTLFLRVVKKKEQKMVKLTVGRTSAVNTLCVIMYVFFWVFPRRLIVVCRRFGTLYLFHLHRLDVKYEVWLVRRILFV